MPKPWLSNILLFLKGNLVQNPQDQRDELHPSADFKDQSFESMAAHGGQAQLPVADGLHPMQRAADGARDEAPSPGADKLRRGDGEDRGAPNSEGDILHGPNTWDDSPGEDNPDPAPRVSSTHGSMPTRSRACEKDREQARSLPGVHSMRPGEEGPGDRLRGPQKPRSASRSTHYNTEFEVIPEGKWQQSCEAHRPIQQTWPCAIHSHCRPVRRKPPGLRQGGLWEQHLRGAWEKRGKLHTLPQTLRPGKKWAWTIRWRTHK